MVVTEADDGTVEADVDGGRSDTRSGYRPKRDERRAHKTMFAWRRATKDARAILPGLELLREVEALILEGSVVRDHAGGRDAFPRPRRGVDRAGAEDPQPVRGAR